jgi:hypothetical protein
MAKIYERSQARLDEFVRAMPRGGNQVGAVFSISGKIAGVDIFDSPDTFDKALPKLIRSYAVDALERPVEAATNILTADAVRDFLDDIALVDVNRFKAVGLGDDLRFNSAYLVGAALQVSAQIVHLISFPRSFFADNQEKKSRHRRMARVWTRRAFH